MALIDMADGRTYSTDVPYEPLRAAVFEKKTDQLEGVVFGPGNPPFWIQISVQGGYVTFNVAAVVAIRP